jgi:hypothetical protein
LIPIYLYFNALLCTDELIGKQIGCWMS